MKLNNITSLDPAETARGIKGLSGASKLDRQFWDEYQSNRFELVMEIEETLERHATNQPSLTKETDAQVLVNTRRGQNFFRRTVLASYNNRCCITGNCVPRNASRQSHCAVEYFERSSTGSQQRAVLNRRLRRRI